MSNPTLEEPPSDAGEPGSGSVRLAALPAASSIVPLSASRPAYSRLSVLSPGTTRYVKLSVSVPLPLAYRISFDIPLMLSASVGRGGASGTDTGSSKRTDTLRSR